MEDINTMVYKTLIHCVYKMYDRSYTVCINTLLYLGHGWGRGGQWYCISGHTWQYFRMILKTCVVLPINATPMLSSIMRLLLWRTISGRSPGRIPWMNDAKLLVTVSSSWLPTTTKTDRRLLLVTTLPLISLISSYHMGKPGQTRSKETGTDQRSQWESPKWPISVCLLWNEVWLVVVDSPMLSGLGIFLPFMADLWMCLDRRWIFFVFWRKKTEKYIQISPTFHHPGNYFSSAVKGFSF